MVCKKPKIIDNDCSQETVADNTVSFEIPPLVKMSLVKLTFLFFNIAIYCWSLITTETVSSDNKINMAHLV